jgi:preprotein translocase subunit YajC
MPVPSFLLVHAAGAPAGAAGAYQLLLFGAIFAIFYFVAVAPMRKRQKALDALVSGLKKGDRVITTGGIYGEVSAVEGGIIHLRIADNVRIRIAKSAIAGLDGEPQEGSRK